MSPDPQGDVARLRAICAAFPRTAEKLSHGMPVFYIDKGRTFAWYTHDHHGDGRSAVLVKTSGSDEQQSMIERDPEGTFLPAYMTHSGWIALRTDQDATDWEHVADRVRLGWLMIAPARVREAFDG